MSSECPVCPVGFLVCIDTSVHLYESGVDDHVLVSHEFMALFLGSLWSTAPYTLPACINGAPRRSTANVNSTDSFSCSSAPLGNQVSE